MELKKGNQQTEIGIIPEDWEIETLGNLLKFKNGLNKEKEFFGKGTPIINYMDVFSSSEIKKEQVNGKVTLSRGEIKNYSAKLGDVFFTRTSETQDEIGMTSVLLDEIKDCTFSGFVLRGRPISNKLFNGYSKYCFREKNVRRQIISTSSYTTRALTNGRLLSNVQISIPSTIEEQKQIANTLSDTNQLIQSLKKLINKKKAIKQGAIEELLTGKKRLQGFTQKWESKKLGSSGKTISGLSGKTKADFGNGNARYITFMNVISNVVINTSILEKVNIKQGETQNTFKKGDLFFNTSSETPDEVGMCAVLLEDIEDIYLNSFCFGYRLNNEELNELYLSYLINSNIGRSIFENLAQGATRYNLSKKNFNNIILNVPKDINEQLAITQILSDMDAEIEALEKQLQKTQFLKKGMMQELLTGRIRLVKPVAQEKIKPLAMVTEPKVVYKKKTKPKKHNEHINDAVLIGTMANVFGSDKFPLTRFMYTKVSYLLKRFKEEETLGYLKKAAGSYKPKTRYGGAEKIALQNQYVKKHISNYKGKKYENFLAGDNVTEAINYFKDWYGENALKWIEQFKYVKRNQLELWATVDMAIEDLKIEEKSVNFGTVKELINNHKEWRPKLKRPIFSDSNIEEAINKVNQLFL